MIGFRAKQGKFEQNKKKIRVYRKPANPHDWRTGWDSNPRAGVTDKLISSQPRYDHFDTRPYIKFFIC